MKKLKLPKGKFGYGNVAKNLAKDKKKYSMCK